MKWAKTTRIKLQEDLYSKRFWKKFRKYRLTELNSCDTITQSMWEQYQINNFILMNLKR